MLLMIRVEASVLCFRKGFIGNFLLLNETLIWKSSIGNHFYYCGHRCCGSPADSSPLLSVDQDRMIGIVKFFPGQLVALPSFHYCIHIYNIFADRWFGFCKDLF